MAKLTPKARAGLVSDAFAGPGRTYPVPDQSHARAAKSDASHAANVGNISRATEAKIDAKANKVLKKGK